MSLATLRFTFLGLDIDFGLKQICRTTWPRERISFGIGLDPARLWFSIANKENAGKFDFHLHAYLPFARMDEEFVKPYGLPSLQIGYRRQDGSWRYIIGGSKKI